jgi:hypothetical protein
MHAGVCLVSSSRLRRNVAIRRKQEIMSRWEKRTRRDGWPNAQMAQLSLIRWSSEIGILGEQPGRMKRPHAAAQMACGRTTCRNNGASVLSLECLFRGVQHGD